LALVPLFALSTFLHIAALKDVSRFPLLCTDETQYVSVAENIRHGSGFTIRGAWHSGLPPLFPLLIAFAHSLGDDSRAAALALSCLVMSLAIFPAYGIARLAGLSRGISLGLAAVTAFLPHTLFAGLYMTEVLEYPLFFTAFYFALRWVDGPRSGTDVALGLSIGAMLLTKVAASSFLATFLVTALCLGLAGLRSTGGRRMRWGRHTALVLAIALGLQLAWQLYKHAHGASALGNYGTELGEHGLPFLSWKLLAIYWGDFLLAAGLLTPVPLFVWFRQAWSSEFPRFVLVLSTLALQIGIHGTLESGINGSVRERLMMYSFPIMAIFAVKGLTATKCCGVLLKAAFILAPLLLLFGLNRYGFNSGSAMDAPLAFTLGWHTQAGTATFSHSRFLLSGSAVIILAGAALLYLRVQRATGVFVCVVLGCQATAFLVCTHVLGELSLRTLAHASGFLRLLDRNGVTPEDRVVVPGRMQAFEDRRWHELTDSFLVDWSSLAGANDILMEQIEILRRLDTRTLNAPERIEKVLRPGDWLLAATRFNGLTLAGFAYPLYLYRYDSASHGPFLPEYSRDIPGAAFAGGASPPIYLPRGTYRVRVSATSSQGAVTTVKLLDSAGAELSRWSGTASEAPPLHIATTGAPFVCRIRCSAARGFRLDGITVEWENPPLPLVPGMPLSEQFSAVVPGPIGAEPITVAHDCGVDLMNGAPPGPTTHLRQGMTINGWAADKTHGVAPSRVFFELSGSGRRYFAPATLYPRPDIVRASHKPELLNSGVKVAAGFAAVPAGRYELSIIALFGSSVCACTDEHGVEVE
jgi:hypothetical protein